MHEHFSNIDTLREIALDQYGFVTTAQAVDSGVSNQAISMLVKRQRLEHIAQGVYRVPQTPVSQFDGYMLALLWTGTPEACLSHETALDLYSVCDINPTAIHITVSKKRRIKRKGGEEYILHKQDLIDSQITWHEGMRIATLPVAVSQCIKNNVPTYLLRQAIGNGGRLGLIDGNTTADLETQLEDRDGKTSQSS